MKLHLLCAALLGIATGATAQTQGGTRPADPAKPTDSAKSLSLDGTWTVVSIEKNGQPIKDAKDMTVTVKDNTLTFGGKDAKEAMSVRFEFAGPGQARVMMDEMASGTGTGTGGTGTGGTGGTGSQGGTGTGGTGRDDKGGTGGGAKAGMKQAVYVLTSDYLAVCVHDDKASGTGGTGTGGTGGTGQGGTGTGGTGQGGTGTASQPTTNTYCSIILKRSGTGTGR